MIGAAEFRYEWIETAIGVGIVVPGAWNTNELNTCDPTASAAFYAALFGWQADPVDFGFSIDDAVAAAERAARLGGSVVVSPFDAGPGIRVSVLADPGGTAFSVTRYAP